MLNLHLEFLARIHVHDNYHTSFIYFSVLKQSLLLAHCLSYTVNIACLTRWLNCSFRFVRAFVLLAFCYRKYEKYTKLRIYYAMPFANFFSYCFVRLFKSLFFF